MLQAETKTGWSRVLAVDPGGTSGWAVLDDGSRFMSGQHDFEGLMELAERLRPRVIIAERYTVTAETLRKSRQTTALETIGALRWLAHKLGAPFLLQLPADAKRFCTDERLEKAGWLAPKTADHANDAARHLMLYCVKTKIMEVPR